MDATPIPTELRIALNKIGIFSARMINGKLYGIQRFMFTFGLLVDIDPYDELNFYKYRYCYPTFNSANDALCEWDGENFPPGPWIKRKGEGGDLKNPNFEPRSN